MNLNGKLIEDGPILAQRLTIPFSNLPLGEQVGIGLEIC